MAVQTMHCPECNVEFGVTSYGVAFRMDASEARRTLTPRFLIGVAVGGGLLAVVMALVGVGLVAGDAMKPNTRRPDPPVGKGFVGVPEVGVANPVAHSDGPGQAKFKINQLIANIRNENVQGRDAFVLANMKIRPELQGMPFIMGDACRQEKGKAASFQSSVSAVRDGLDRDSRLVLIDTRVQHSPFWTI